MLTFLKHNSDIISAYRKNKQQTESHEDNKPCTSEENHQENEDEDLSDAEEW